MDKPRFHKSLLVLIILISGCAKIPTQDTIADKTHIPTNFNNSYSSNIIAKNLDYRETFFTIFDDEILQKIALKAIRNNTNLLTLESTLIQAKASAKVNTWNLFPKTNIGVNYNYSDNNYQRIQTNITQNTTNANLSFSWEVDIFGKLNALRKASKQQVLEALQNLNQAKVTLLGDLANYYFLIRQIRESITINEAIEKNLFQILALTQQQYDLGLIGLESLALAKTNYLNQKNTTLSLSYSLEQNKNALLILLNSNDIGFDINANYDFTTPRIPNITAMPMNVIFNRPDVKADIFALNASIYQRYNKKMSLLPSLNINGNLGQILSSPTLVVGDLVWQIASSISTPLVNRQTITQDYIISKENTKQAFYTLQNTINTAVGEIENSFKNMQIATQSLENLQSSYDINKNSYEIIQERYNQQLIDEVSKLDNENTYLRSKDALLQAHLSANQAAISIYKAFGGNFNPNALNKNDLSSGSKNDLESINNIKAKDLGI